MELSLVRLTLCCKVTHLWACSCAVQIFPRERPGLNYDLNWSLADDDVSPHGDAYRNAPLSVLHQYGLLPSLLAVFLPLLSLPCGPAVVLVVFASTPHCLVSLTASPCVLLRFCSAGKKATLGGLAGSKGVPLLSTDGPAAIDLDEFDARFGQVTCLTELCPS